MDREQAIKELKEYSIPCGKYVEAYKMAIKSLEEIEHLKEYIKGRIEYHKDNSELIAVGKTYAYKDILELIEREEG